MGKVYLVGAGPGNSELITIRGMELLKKCDAVIYDSLSGEDLLKLVPDKAEKIYVGKRAGAHYRKQEEINEIIVDVASRCGIVVRLKGGDPFVFGRGGEEIEILIKHGIAYEVVPGVSSAVAVPELAGIPVTHRAVSRSFHVITGHTKEGIADCDYEVLAKAEGTLVFLMGLNALAKITEGLVNSGKSSQTPVAVISDGSLDSQRVVRGNLSNIVKLSNEASMTTPAIIVVGEVARFDFLCKRPITVGITATRRLYKSMRKKLEDSGIASRWVCKMEIEKDILELERLSNALDNIEEFSWILFSSQNAIDIFFDLVKEKKIDMRTFYHVKFGVIGTGSQRRLLSHGIKADFMPSVYNVETMAREFADTYAKDCPKVLIPRAKQGNTVILNIFDKSGICYNEYAIYDVEGKRCVDFTKESFDGFAFLSGSGVEAFFDGLSEEELDIVKEIPMACIGNMTSKAIGKISTNMKIVADRMNVEGLADKLAEYFMSKNR